MDKEETSMGQIFQSFLELILKRLTLPYYYYYFLALFAAHGILPKPNVIIHLRLISLSSSFTEASTTKLYGLKKNLDLSVVCTFFPQHINGVFMVCALWRQAWELPSLLEKYPRLLILKAGDKCVEEKEGWCMWPMVWPIRGKTIKNCGQGTVVTFFMSCH